MKHGAVATSAWVALMNDASEVPVSPASPHGTITIKKYANRRLYNTATSCYVTLDYLSQLVKSGANFAVYDAKTGEDITRSVLTHIIVEEEAKGQSLLPVSFLRHLISFYGDSLQTLVPRYLEQTMQAFAHNQENMRDYLRGAFEPLNPFSGFEEMSKQQMALFERTMRMFSPFYAERNEPDGGAAAARADEPAAANTEAQIAELRAKLDSLQKQLNELVGKKRED
jgi:polyhydroxyalkanoate synthesis repressor PhaR